MLLDAATDALNGIEGVRIIGEAAEKSPVVSFVTVLVSSVVVVVPVTQGFPSHAVNTNTAAIAVMDLRIVLLKACLIFFHNLPASYPQVNESCAVSVQVMQEYRAILRPLSGWKIAILGWCNWRLIDVVSAPRCDR